MASMAPKHSTGNPTSTFADRRNLWQMAWHAATSDTLLVVTFLGLAALLLLAAALPQAPSNSSNLAEYSRWLDSVQRRFGSANTWMQPLGLFAIYNTILFRVLIGLASCALAARLVNSIEYVAVDRKSWSNIARIAATLGGLILIVGIASSSAYGWRVQDISIGIGETAPIGPNTPYTVRLERLDATSIGQITLLRETEPVATGIIASGRALHIAGLSAYLREAGPAVRASAVISDEQPLSLLSSAASAPANELLLKFTPDEPEQLFAIPDAASLVRLSFSPATGSFRVLVYRTQTGATPFEDNLPPDGIVRVANLTLKLMPEEYANLSIRYDPGTWPTGIGLILSTLGLLGIWIWPAAVASTPSEEPQETTGD